jgi:microcystin-dependent protein
MERVFMADKVKTILNEDYTSAVTNSAEITFNVPDSDTNPVIDFERRLFTQSSLQIWTGTGGTGTQLTFGVDYQVTGLNEYATSKAGVNVYTGISILNATYYDTDLYIPVDTLEGYGDNLDASDVNRLQSQIDLLSVGAGGIPIGGINFFATSTAPTGWLSCDGSAVSRTTYSALFAAIGTTFGVGDGSTTFNLPDPREAALIATGTNGTHTIAASNPLALGDFQDDQMQGHYHAGDGGLGSGAIQTAARNTASSTDDADSFVKEPISDGTNGTPRTGTTTHGKQFGLLACIKALEVTGAGDLVLSPVEPVVLEFLESTLSSGVNEKTHGLNMPFDELSIKVYVDPAGTGKIDITANTSGTSEDRGLTVRESSVDALNNIAMNLGTGGLIWINNSGSGSIGTPATNLITVVIQPKNPTDLAILQNNGGYNYEERHDISTTGVQIDLSSLWQQPDGFIASYAWTGGDGTAQITFDGGTYTGKTIGGVDADTLAADLAGDGQGRITFRKDGNDLRILTQGVFDSDGGNFSGSDSDTFRKYSDGAMTQTASGTAATGEPARNFVIPFSSAPRGSGSPVTASANRNFTFDLITATQFTPELENSTDEQYDALFVGRWIEEYLEVG